MMDDRMAELAKEDYEKESLIESKKIPNHKKHLETCAKNKRIRKSKRKRKK